MITVFQIINIIIGVCLLGLMLNQINKKQISKQLKFKFAEGNTPILTVFQDDVELNFIIDTGSSVSAIDSNVLDNIYAQKLSKNVQIIGIEGTTSEANCYEIPFSYNNYEYNHTFVAKDFAAAFTPVAESIKKPIHGLIGSDFCEKNGFVIDFQTLSIHAK